MIRHIAGLAEIVEDVNEALNYYQDVLGLVVEQRDGDHYAMIAVPGVLHFGIWERGRAAEMVFGSRDHADRIPLGFTMEVEVDDVEAAAERVGNAGREILQAPREEPWGQKTFRMISPGGSLVGFAQTPWARRITQDLETTADESAGTDP